MNPRLLVTTAAAVVCAISALAVPPAITVNRTSYTITVDRGARIAYQYSVRPGGRGNFATGIETDSDRDGAIVVGVERVFGASAEAQTMIAVDLNTGQFGVAGLPFEAGFPDTSVVRGPSGGMSELFIEASRAAIFWVRPRTGAWMPMHGTLFDADKIENNGLVAGTLWSTYSVASSPPPPAGLERGDLLLIHANGTISGGVVNAMLSTPDSPGVISLAATTASARESDRYPISIVRRGGSEGTVSVRCCTTVAGYPALEGVDFFPVEEVVTFGPGEVVKNIEGVTMNDTVFTSPRSFALQLHSPSGGAALGERSMITTTIVSDNDPVPSVAVDGSPLLEGDGPTEASIPVTLLGARRGPITLRYSTSLDPSPRDHVFPEGESSGHLLVAIPGDDVPKDDYPLKLSARVAGNNSPMNTFTLMVVDDDLPTLTFSDAVAQEGMWTEVPFRVEPRLQSKVSTFTWKTVDGTARAGSDYSAASYARGTYEPGFSLLQDSEVEGDEVFYIEISEVVNAVAVRTRIPVTIVDDDELLPVPASTDVRVVEGTGGTTFAVVPLTLPAPRPIAMTYRVMTASGTAGYEDYRWGDVTFEAGQTTAEIPLAITADTIPESDETFTVDVAGWKVPITVTIVDDDPGVIPLVSIEDFTVKEGTGSQSAGVAMIAVRLSAPATHPILVDFKTMDGTAKTPQDYHIRAERIGFKPGQTLYTIAIYIIADSVGEPTEDFRVVLQYASGAVISRGTATVTIADDDGPQAALPAVSVDDAAVVEGTVGVKTMTFPVTLSAPSASEVRVGFSMKNDTASEGSDYVPKGGTLSIPAGQTHGQIDVEVIPDGTIEPAERFQVILHAAAGAVIAKAVGYGTIENDDLSPAKGRSVRH